MWSWWSHDLVPVLSAMEPFTLESLHSREVVSAKSKRQASAVSWAGSDFRAPAWMILVAAQGHGQPGGWSQLLPQREPCFCLPEVSCCSGPSGMARRGAAASPAPGHPTASGLDEEIMPGRVLCREASHSDSLVSLTPKYRRL